ncbi:MAG: serine/threonine protein kinase [Huintestinicola sp.]|uniref:serine/threonine protein kinase n=1 Tax=Huintestinicola sp. TaxID=2981661 RepID=UPI003EFCFE95
MITIGQILNDTYKIVAALGSGGGGTVFQAYHLRMQKNVAVKLIKDNVRDILCSRAEVDILKELKNEYLPQVIDFVEDGDEIYTVMEYIEGKNFRQLIEGGRRFSENQVIKYGVQLCSALKYLHGHIPPIIHSDIKPSNIMLTPYDNICLIDFNISMISKDGIAAPAGGSKNFAAPEQFRRMVSVPKVDAFHELTRFIGDDETELDDGSNSSLNSTRTKNLNMAYIDIRTDIYGVGASLYYILTGRIPSDGCADFRGIKVSSKLKSCILKAMCKDPDGRYRNAEEMERALLSKNRSVSTAATAAVSAAALICAVGAAALAAGKKSESTSLVNMTETAVAFEQTTAVVSESFPIKSVSVHSEENTAPQAEYDGSNYDADDIIIQKENEAAEPQSAETAADVSETTTAQASLTAAAVTTFPSVQYVPEKTTDISAEQQLEKVTEPAITEKISVKAEDFTSYYVSGTIHSKLTGVNSDGSYEVTWYWQNGLEKYVESYDPDNELINLRVISLETRKTNFYGKPDMTSEGYSYTRKNDDANYPYVRYYIDSDRNVILQCYLDENKNEKMTRTYKVYVDDDGYLCITWYNGNGEKVAYREYDTDGSRRK